MCNVYCSLIIGYVRFDLTNFSNSYRKENTNRVHCSYQFPQPDFQVYRLHSDLYSDEGVKNLN